MNKLIKVVNKFNGNFCFAGITDDGNYIFECDREDGTLSFVNTSQLITDVCLNNANSYLVAFGNSWLGKFENGVLNEEYVDTGFTKVEKVVKSTENEIYIIDSDVNQLIKIIVT